MTELGVGLGKVDNQGRISLCKVLVEGVREVRIDYDFQTGSIRVKEAPKEKLVGNIFELPTAKVDDKRRLCIPSWIKKLTSEKKVSYYRYNFEGEFLVLTPVFGIEKTPPKISIY